MTRAKAPIEPFELGDGDRGALLLHGLTGSPWDMQRIARALARAGWRCHVPLLRGHDNLDTLERTTWSAWYADAERAFDRLVTMTSTRIVVGFSMGSLLALRLAARRGSELAGTVAISVPFAFPSWKRRTITGLARLRSIPLVGRWVGRHDKRGGIDVRRRRPAERSPGLMAFPYPSLRELVRLQSEVASCLPRVETPLLLLHGALDHAAAAEDSARVAQRVASADVRRVVMPRSFHLLPRDLDADHACDEIVAFADRVLASDPTRRPAS
ncbi:MAG: alpha/beta fold hydrolase [Myxococcales bacterium FL481]|nr:MAG: alpha/beta fold hydrolase [Myxococcales bacterium FL481]